MMGARLVIEIGLTIIQVWQNRKNTNPNGINKGDLR
jgi:hypothetical protein